MSNFKGFFSFLYNIFLSRKILWRLSKNDLIARFASSFLGILWAFIQPLVTLLVFWFVFEMGFKTPPISNLPFMLWFAPAYLVWAYFSESLLAGTNSLREYHYLVKKVNFRVSTIPIVKVLSSSYVHVAFIGIIFLLYMCYGYMPSIYNIQVVYYFFCTFILLIGLSWLVSAVAVFVPDMVNIINVFIQIGFWITPIVWDVNLLSPQMLKFFKLNPMFYICRGYRDSFISGIWFWEYGLTNVYFWIVTGTVFIMGALMFKRLRPHFADVL